MGAVVCPYICPAASAARFFEPHRCRRRQPDSKALVRFDARPAASRYHAAQSGGRPVDPKVTDLHATLGYHAKRNNLRILVLGATALILGLFLVSISSNPFRGTDGLMLIFTLGLGATMTPYALFRTLFPGRPELIFLPEGLAMNMHGEWMKEIIIPWQVVRGIEKANIDGDFRGTPVRYEGVTVLLVPRSFYDRHIHIGLSLRRGPAWDSYFIPVDNMVQVALHHNAFGVSAEELRTAAELRWKAFGNPPQHLPRDRCG
jgi:hypothetical protein